MNRLLATFSMLLITAALSMEVHAKGNEIAQNAHEDDVWIVLYYAAVVDHDPLAEFYLANPEADGALEYGDYCYWSYAGSKGGSYRQSSGDSRDAGRSSESDGEFANPEEDGSTEYGDYGYYSYAGSKGGSYKQSSSGSDASD